MAVLVLSGTVPAAAVPTFTGPEVQDAKLRSIDVVDSHLSLMGVQARFGQPPSYVGGTVRWAPGRILLNTGERVAANLSRSQLTFGGGFGSLDGGALFAGAIFDFVMLSNPLYGSIPNFTGNEGGEAEAFAGVGFRGVQLSYSLAVSGIGESGSNRDPWGNYQPANAEELPLRPGAPVPDTPGNERPAFSFLSAYEERTGAFLALVWVEHGGESKLSEVRANLQPLSGIVPQGIRDVAGLPSIGLRKLDDAIDYYREARSGDLVSAGEPVPEPPTLGTSQYETDFGADDVLRGGLRWRARLRVSPSVTFRYAELGYVDDFDLEERAGLRVGARLMVVSSEGSYAPAGESVVLGRIGPRERGLHVGFSYSYDSPDGVTFLPIRDAHVFGLQVVYGPPETSRPIVPLVREIERRRGPQEGKK